MSLTGKSPDFEVLSHQPLRGQPNLSRLSRAAVTPTEDFFVCHRGPAPELLADQHQLTVEGMVKRPLHLRLPDLAALFLELELTLTLQSAGLRGREMAPEDGGAGSGRWGASALGTATWGGVGLSEVLQAAGVLDGARFVALHSASEGAEAFSACLPIDKGLDPDTLIAYRMNGDELPALHGGPLRAVVPGYVGSHSVKWLSRVEVRLDELVTDGPCLRPPGASGPGLTLREASVTSAITAPADGADLEPGAVTVGGWALAGGRRTVERVDVSADHGKTWQQAELGDRLPGRWVLWQAELALEPGPHQLVCRAWDSAANTQPEEVASIWNPDGVMNNAWHRVRVWCE